MNAKVAAGNLFLSATSNLVDGEQVDNVPDLVVDSDLPGLENDELVVDLEPVEEQPLYPIPNGPPLSP
jgi:hypothetical protein